MLDVISAGQMVFEVSVLNLFSHKLDIIRLFVFPLSVFCKDICKVFVYGLSFLSPYNVQQMATPILFEFCVT